MTPDPSDADADAPVDADVTFRDLGLSEDILTALDELGYESPSPIQEQAIPELLAGHDVIGQAQTGHRQDRGVRPAAAPVPRSRRATRPRRSC